MQFQRLRVSGFKSFVEPAELRFEPGLTGIVGPNGCGKSNLLEALRWVMGASSAKAMRADGMDDVIFGGAAGRPARNHAEVSLQIDNAQHRAPARFNDAPVIEVARRISRGGGSVYRVNGVETRARDVQLLFADASTGANSPAMVRQGQVSELIAAKPSNRRRTLEEAAGVSGLHARRQEAHLRLNAAEANLARLDDVIGEVGQAQSRLKREARHAERYRRLAAEIRAAEAGALYARWAEAQALAAEAQAVLDGAERSARDQAGAAASAAVRAFGAAATVEPAREAVVVATAVLARAAVAQERLDQDAKAASADLASADEALARNAADREREAAMAQDARANLDRIGHELAAVERDIVAAPERQQALEQALMAAETAREAAERRMEASAAAAATHIARQENAAAHVRQAAKAQRAATERLIGAQARCVRLSAALAAGRADRLGLAADDRGADAEGAVSRLKAMTEALGGAREALQAAERDRAEAQTTEAASHEASRRDDDRLRRLRSEADGLAELTAVGHAGAEPALAAVRTLPGYEAALAAALRDDLDAALDPTAPAYWKDLGDAEALPVRWPYGAAPLGPYVDAPPALDARLRLTALADRAAGPALQAALPVGARLVSREGDMWRWDGLTVRAEAANGTAVRLAQQARLDAIQDEIDALSPQAAELVKAHRAAAERVRAGEAALHAARRGLEAAERDAALARDAVERTRIAAAQAAARERALDESAIQLGGALEEAEAARAVMLAQAEACAVETKAAEAERAAVSAPTDGDRSEGEAPARSNLAAVRQAEVQARSALETERRSRDSRQGRRTALSGEAQAWERRAAAAAGRLDALDGERERLAHRRRDALDRPGALDAARQRAGGELAAAETRRAQAGDALAEAQATADVADRAAREADRAAAEAREAQAAAAARRDAAAERLASTSTQLRAATGLDAPALRERLSSEAVDAATGVTGVADPAALEAQLQALKQDRDALGPVNLRAEAAAEEETQRLERLTAERADLDGALAKLRAGVETLNREGRDRLLAAFEVVNRHFQALFQTLFDGGQAELRLIESDDPLEAGLEIFACPPGKRLSSLSLMSGGEQALTACALILAVFLANPAPICVLDEVDAPLDDANVDRFCRLLDEMRRRTDTRFVAITHNPVTMSRMDRLFGVTMAERGVSRLVSVDLRQAEALAAQ